MNSAPHSNPRRTAWMSARARNAAKRGGRVAAVGALAVAATMLLLVLVPREVNRAVRARIEALPANTDTVPLQANLTGALDRIRNAEANLQALRVAYADRIVSASGSGDASGAGQGAPAGSEPGDQNEARKDLGIRVARARAAPLVENFRAVGEVEALRNEPRARVLLDSLNEVNRDREAYAALGGGPDARYAAMTARLSALGLRLLLLAEQRLAAPGAVMAAPSAVTRVDAPITDSLASPPADTAILTQLPRFYGDSLAERSAREGLDSAKIQLQLAEQSLKAARESNLRLDEVRTRAEAGLPARVPLVAMLLSALIIGLAVGYGVAFYYEVKHPRVADAAEVERVTDARVIVHSGPSRSSLSMRHRRQSDDALPHIVDSASESYQLLHVTLTGFGDTSREVQIVSNDSLLGATVGINLAAAAARDSRTTLLVDSNKSARFVSRLLRLPSPSAAKSAAANAGANANANQNSRANKGRNKQSKASKATPPRNAAITLRSQVVRARVGRDLFVDVVPANAHVDAHANASTTVVDELLELAREHDFTVLVQPDTVGEEVGASLPAMDVIMCARMGVTRLDWLTARAAELQARNHRVRAVLLWATRPPVFR